MTNSLLTAICVKINIRHSEIDIFCGCSLYCPATIHLDETMPHLQLYYIPIVDMAKKRSTKKIRTEKYYRTRKARLFRRKTDTAKAFMSMSV